MRRTHAGIRRAIGTAQAAKAPAVVGDLRRMLSKRDQILMVPHHTDQLGSSSATDLSSTANPRSPFTWDALRGRGRSLKRDTLTLYLAARDPRTPWYARVLAAAVVVYALSPFDPIPDFVPVLGYLDDMIVVPLGIAAVLRLIPADVLADSRAQARMRMERPVSWVGAAFMVAVWVAPATWVALIGALLRRLRLAAHSTCQCCSIRPPASSV